MDLAADPQARAIGPDQRNPAGKGGALQAAELKGASNLLHGKAVNHSSILPFHAGLRGGHLTIACDLGIPLLFLVIGTLDSSRENVRGHRHGPRNASRVDFWIEPVLTRDQIVAINFWGTLP